MRKGVKAVFALAGSLAVALALGMWPVERGLEVETIVIQQGQLTDTMKLSGRVCYDQEQPLICPKDGIVSHVYVQPGQEVEKGELLLKMDTSVEEKSLAALYEWKNEQKAALEKMDHVMAALALQSEWEQQSTERQLLASIEASFVRAPEAGIIEGIYVKEGGYAFAKDLLGIVRGKEKKIASSVSAVQMNGIYTGKTASAQIGYRDFSIILDEMVPSENNGMQTLVFSCDELADIQIGEYADIEMMGKVYPVSALLPLSAIDANGKVWRVENGRVYQSVFQPEFCSGTQVSADSVWVGQRIILYPEKYDLKDGMTVRVIE